MPSGAKNVKFTNRHANEANARKAEEAGAAKAKKAQMDEDNAWKDDDDKQGKKKAERAAEKDEKDRLAMERKAEREAELEAEEKSLEKKPPKAVSKKEQQRLMAAMVRDFDMEARMNKTTEDEGDLAKRHGKVTKDLKQERVVEKKLVDGNPNHDAPTAGGGGGAQGQAAAGSLDAAKAKAPIDARHIGKRARVAYRKFENANLEGLKASKPGLRRTQYSDLMWGMWQKSPENPFVQRQVRQANEMLERKWCQNDEEPSDDEGMEDD